MDAKNLTRLEIIENQHDEGKCGNHDWLVSRLRAEAQENERLKARPRPYTVADQLQEDVERLRDALKSAERRAEVLEGCVRELRDALIAADWAYVGLDNRRYCTVCARRQDKQHTADCLIATGIARANALLSPQPEAKEESQDFGGLPA